MTIPFVDLQAQYSRLKSDIDSRIAAVLSHGQFIMGPEVAAFERELSAFAGAKHAVGVGSGTDALQIALMAKGVGSGDAVFLPSFTFSATAEVVLLLGANPVFVDVDRRNFNIDLDDLERRIRIVEKDGNLTPKAIVAVDLFGLPAQYSALTDLAEAHDLLLIADAAQSFGAKQGNERVGSLAPMTATSFFPAKPLGCYGDGGALLTNDENWAETFRSIRAHGKGKAKYELERIGLNSRLDTIQAAILSAKLTIFEDELASRRRLAADYDEILGNTIEIPIRMSGSDSAWAQYAILLDKRDSVAARLKEKGIPTAVYYPTPMHMQPPYQQFGDGAGSLPVSESLCERILCLPMHPYQDKETTSKIATAVIECVAQI